MRVMMVVNLALFLVLVLFGVSVFTPRKGAVRLPKSHTHGSGARHLEMLLLICLLTGGSVHSSSGLDKNAVQFTFEKIAPRVYRVTLGNLSKGEYGFLPPGGQFGALGGGASGAMIMQGSASAGKIYSFRVIE